MMDDTFEEDDDDDDDSDDDYEITGDQMKQHYEHFAKVYAVKNNAVGNTA